MGTNNLSMTIAERIEQIELRLFTRERIWYIQGLALDKELKELLEIPDKTAKYVQYDSTIFFHAED